MDLTSEVKASVLLQILEFHMNEIHRCEESEKTWFEWASGLLLATFGATIALASSSKLLQQSVYIKILATVLILVPAIISNLQIRAQARNVLGSAEVVERIEEMLHLFEKGYYDKDKTDEKSLYPTEWHNLARTLTKRKTPNYYIEIITLMAACVIIAVWLIL